MEREQDQFQCQRDKDLLVISEQKATIANLTSQLQHHQQSTAVSKKQKTLQRYLSTASKEQLAGLQQVQGNG